MDRVKFNAALNERIYADTLSNGMKCYIIPKEGFVEKQAMLAVNYGSADIGFKLDGKKQYMPEGIAHFLEHKMFENKKISVFDEFIKNGGSANAFTNFNSTAFYFNCNEHFYRNLRLLLKFTAQPHFTAENVEKEKEIIVHEIEMYNDNPFWVAHMNLLDALYEVCPIRYNIAGTAQSVRSVNHEMLHRCYDTFYTPDNMALVCVGGLNPERVVWEAEKLAKKSPKHRVVRLYGKEPSHAVKSYAEQKMSVARPMFRLGFKDSDFSCGYVERLTASKVLLEMLAGESSDFFETLYNDRLVDGPFVPEYIAGSFYGIAMFSNTSDRPREAASRILGEIDRLGLRGLSANRFETARRKLLGRFIRSFNAIENITVGQMDLGFKNLDLFDIAKGYHALTLEKVCKRFNTLFRDDNFAVSVVSP